MQTDAKRFFEERYVIKANPLITTLRTMCFLLAFTIIAFLAIVILLFVLDLVFEGGKFFSKNSIFPFYIFLIVLNSFNLAMSMRQARYWKRIEQRRFAAVQGNQNLLAAEQPRLRVLPMWLPGTLKLRHTKNLWLRMVGMILLMALLFAGAFSFDGPLFFTSNRLLFFLVLFCIGAIGCLALLFVLLYFTSRQKIEPTEYGLTTRHAGKNATVIWSEARLFALYDTFGVQKSGASITYELSSAREIVRWTWVQGKAPFASQEPVISQDEYNLQMQGLLALVQARTGLPLYDLRQMGEG